MAYVIHIHQGAHGPGRTETFAQSPIRVGRNPLNDLVLEDPMVSQIHGVISFNGGEVSYVDVGSSNGTLVNGSHVVANQPVPLAIRGTDRVQLGSLVLSITEINLPHSVAVAPVPRRTVFNERRFGASMFISKEQLQDAGAPDASAAAQEPAPPSPDQKAIDAAVTRALEETGPAIDAHRKATTKLVTTIERSLDGLVDAEKAAVLEKLIQSVPQIALEPALEPLFEQFGIDAPGIAPAAAQRFLRCVVEGTDPAGVESQSTVGARRALERIGAVLETQSDAFVELRRGYRHFAEELGVTTVGGQDALSHSLDRADLHRHIFDWSADGDVRVDELKRAYADLALHQVALLQGVIAGIRALLAELSPESIATGQTALAVSGAKPKTGWLGRMFPFARARHWTRYEQQHRSYVEEDRFTRTVFGAAFARAYFAVTGGRG